MIDCSGRLSDLVKRMAQVQKSINPSKVSVETYKSLETVSQDLKGFSSYKRNSLSNDYTEEDRAQDKLLDKT